MGRGACFDCFLFFFKEINDGLLLEQGVLEAQRKNMTGNSVL